MKNLQFIMIFFSITSLFCKDFFYVDYSCFKSSDNIKTKTEIYVSIPVYYLEFDKNLTSIFSIKVLIYDGNEIIKKDQWKQKYRISSTEDKYSGAEIPVLSKLELSPGYYKLVVEVEDLVTGKSIDILEVPQESQLFKIAKFEDKFSMSTLQLASRIITDEPYEKSEFFKQGAVILPNPSKIFGTNRPFIYFYTELYGINKDDDIEYFWKILDSDGNEIKSSSIEQKSSPGSSLVLAERASIPSIRTGSYNLILNITNKSKSRTIQGSNNFYIYRKVDFIDNKFQLPENLEDSLSISGKDSIELDIMKDRDILLEYEQVFSTLDKKEQRKYSGLILSGKREFLKRYWTEKEKTERSSRAMFKLFIEKINSEFSTGKVDGWKTDRGRIFLKFGTPDRRDIETYNNEYSDYEEWHYFKGSYNFIFADKHGLGDFKLIHSNYEGEKYDINWKTKIQKSKY